MANAIYPLWKNALMTGATNSDLDTDTTQDGVYAVLVDTGVYTYNAAHQFYSSLSGIVGTEQRITSPTVTTNVFDGANVTYTSLTGNTAGAVVLFRKNSGANTTWRLIAYQDTGVTNLPVTPNGGDVTIQWDATGIFAL